MGSTKNIKYEIKNPYREGVTLIELVVVMGIFVMLAATIRFFPIDFFYVQSLNDDAAKVASVLRGARDRSVTQEGASAWGVHFVNNATGTDYYQVFKGDTFATGIVTERINLNETVQFVTPPSASTTDVMFSKMSGLPTGASSIIISLIVKPSAVKTITIVGSGQIKY